MTLPYTLDRIITINAPRDLVFTFFTESERWATWWGAGSTIEPSVGGRVYIKHPGNVESGGEVVTIDPPSRMVFTYGFQSGKPFPPGGSRVTITLEAVAQGTRLHLTHEFPDTASRDEHVQGWRYQLSLFSNAVANVLHHDVGAKVDAWFSLWAEPNADTRAGTLAGIAEPSVTFRDRYSATDGASELSVHIGAAQRFMPGIALRRRGPARHCQGVVLADWDAVGPDGASRGAGTNVFTLGAGGKIEAVTGFWSPNT